MDVTIRKAPAFDAASPVTRYWLSRCVGFSVTGGGRGCVEAVVSEDEALEPEALLVRKAHGRVRRVPTQSVVAVVPVERTLVLAPRERPQLTLPEVDLQPAAEALATAASVLRNLLVWASIDLARLSRHAWRVGSPIVAARSRRGWEETRRLIASIPWHRFGPSVRSATTGTSQELSRRWSHLRTTSSPPSSGSDSPVEANTTSSG